MAKTLEIQRQEIRTDILAGARTARTQVHKAAGEALKREPRAVEVGPAIGISRKERAVREVEKWKQEELGRIKREETRALGVLERSYTEAKAAPPEYVTEGLTPVEVTLLKEYGPEEVERRRKLASERVYAEKVTKAESEMKKTHVLVAGREWVSNEDYSALSAEDKKLLQRYGVEGYNKAKERQYKEAVSKAEAEARGEWAEEMRKEQVKHEKAVEVQEREQAEFRRTHVEIRKGEWIPEKDYRSLSREDRRLIRKIGVDAFNKEKGKEYKTAVAEEKRLKAESVEIRPNVWVDRKWWESLTKKQRASAEIRGDEVIIPAVAGVPEEVKIVGFSYTTGQVLIKFKSGAMEWKPESEFPEFTKLTTPQKKEVTETGKYTVTTGIPEERPWAPMAPGEAYYEIETDAGKKTEVPALEWAKMSEFEKLQIVREREPSLAEIQAYHAQPTPWEGIPILEPVADFASRYGEWILTQAATFQPALWEVYKKTGLITPEYYKGVKEYKATQLEGLSFWEREARGLFGTLEPTLPAMRAVYPKVTLGEIQKGEWISTGVNVVLLGIPLWLPPVVRGIKAVFPTKLGGLRTVPFSEPAGIKAAQWRPFEPGKFKAPVTELPYTRAQFESAVGMAERALPPKIKPMPLKPELDWNLVVKGIQRAQQARVEAAARHTASWKAYQARKVAAPRPLTPEQIALQAERTREGMRIAAEAASRERLRFAAEAAPEISTVEAFARVGWGMRRVPKYAYREIAPGRYLAKGAKIISIPDFPLAIPAGTISTTIATKIKLTPGQVQGLESLSPAQVRILARESNLTEAQVRSLARTRTLSKILPAEVTAVTTKVMPGLGRKAKVGLAEVTMPARAIALGIGLAPEVGLAPAEAVSTKAITREMVAPQFRYALGVAPALAPATRLRLVPETRIITEVPPTRITRIITEKAGRGRRGKWFRFPLPDAEDKEEKKKRLEEERIPMEMEPYPGAYQELAARIPLLVIEEDLDPFQPKPIIGRRKKHVIREEGVYPVAGFKAIQGTRR